MVIEPNAIMGIFTGDFGFDVDIQGSRGMTHFFKGNLMKFEALLTSFAIRVGITRYDLFLIRLRVLYYWLVRIENAVLYCKLG